MKPVDRFVVTGMGLVSSLGYGVNEVWNNLLNGKENFVDNEVVEGSKKKRYRVSLISDFDPQIHLKRKIVKPLDQATRYCIASTLKALKDSSLEVTERVSERMAIISGSMYHGIGSIFEFKKRCYEDGKDWVGPLHFPGIVFNSLSGQAGIECQIKGPNSSINFGAASGLFAVVKGLEYLKSDRADYVLAGGTEMLHDFLLFKYARLKKMADFYESVHTRPFDRKRDGFLLGEGSCYFMLEKEKSALKRGAKIYGEIENYHTCHSPCINYDNNINALADCMHKAAIHEGNENIDAIICDASGDREVDALEAQAISRLHGTSSPMLTSVKSNIGHTLGASGAFNLFVGLMATVDEQLPPIKNLENEAFNLNFVKNKRKAQMDRIVVNSIDFNNNYASVCIRKYFQ